MRLVGIVPGRDRRAHLRRVARARLRGEQVGEHRRLAEIAQVYDKFTVRVQIIMTGHELQGALDVPGTQRIVAYRLRGAPAFEHSEHRCRRQIGFGARPTPVAAKQRQQHLRTLFTDACSGRHLAGRRLIAQIQIHCHRSETRPGILRIHRDCLLDDLDRFGQRPVKVPAVLGVTLQGGVVVWVELQYFNQLLLNRGNSELLQAFHRSPETPPRR